MIALPLLLTALATSMPTAAARAAAASPGTVPAGFPAQLDRLAMEQMRAQHIPGLVVGVARSGEIVYLNAFGERDAARHLPADARTRFEIGSVSKQFTAAAVLQLADSGALSLDDRLARFVPSYRYAADVTLRQMLAHTSGIPDTQDFAVDAHSGDAFGALLAQLNRKPLVRKPGSGFGYSNANYVLLGRVVEAASKEPLEAYLRNHVLVPAGISGIVSLADEQRLDDVATGYRIDGERPVPSAPMDAAKTRGAGSLVASAEDLLRWNAALYAGRVVVPGDVEAMTSRAVLADGTTSPYGLGVAVDQVAHRTRFWHNGQTFGATAYSAHFPQSGLDVVVLANQSDADVDALAAAVDTVVLRALDPAFQPAVAEPAVANPVDLYFRSLAVMKAIAVPAFVELDYTLHLAHRGRRRAQVWHAIVRSADAQGRYEALNADGSRTRDVKIWPTPVPPALFLARTPRADKTVTAGVDEVPASALPTIGRVQASAYRISLAGREEANGCPDAYRLALVPKRDPDVFNLRTLWIDASTLRICRANVAWMLWIIVRTPVVVTADVGPDGFVSHWTTTGTGRTPLGPYTLGADVRYSDIRTFEGSTDPRLFRR
jgi:D-alanyl-D-alanine carboxypeptidase